MHTCMSSFTPALHIHVVILKNQHNVCGDVFQTFLLFVLPSGLLM